MVREVRGFTLIEVFVVVGVLVLLLAIAFPPFKGWIVKTSIENDVRDIYAFLQEARARAFSEKKDFSVEASGRKLCIKEGDAEVNCIELQNPFSGGVTISRRGYFSQGSFKYNGTADVDRNYDCVVVSLVRVRMGLWNGSECEAK